MFLLFNVSYSLSLHSTPPLDSLSPAREFTHQMDRLNAEATSISSELSQRQQLLFQLEQQQSTLSQDILRYEVQASKLQLSGYCKYIEKQMGERSDSTMEALTSIEGKQMDATRLLEDVRYQDIAPITDMLLQAVKIQLSSSPSYTESIQALLKATAPTDSHQPRLLKEENVRDIVAQIAVEVVGKRKQTSLQQSQEGEYYSLDTILKAIREENE